MYEDDGCYDNLNMDEIDMGFENYEELFAMNLDNPENIFGNDGIFGMKDMSTSNCQGACAAEVIPTMKLLKTSTLFYCYRFIDCNASDIIYTVANCVTIFFFARLVRHYYTSSSEI